MKTIQRSLVSLSVLFACNSLAAGFQVAEHSASGLGRAFSGEGAVADNASVLARNPAAMTLFDTAQFSGAVSIVDPEVNVYDKTNDQQSNDVAPLQVVPADVRCDCLSVCSGRFCIQVSVSWFPLFWETVNTLYTVFFEKMDRLTVKSVR